MEQKQPLQIFTKNCKHTMIFVVSGQKNERKNWEEIWIWFTISVAVLFMHVIDIKFFGRERPLAGIVSTVVAMIHELNWKKNCKEKDRAIFGKKYLVVHTM